MKQYNIFGGLDNLSTELRQISHPYWVWEDFKNGMYEISIDNEDEMIKKSFDLLSNCINFENVLKDVYKYWTFSIQENLSNVKCNRQAWLGQAACSYNHKGTELTTRKAWGLLTDIKRYEANKVADKFIMKYEKENTTVYR